MILLLLFPGACLGDLGLSAGWPAQSLKGAPEKKEEDRLRLDVLLLAYSNRLGTEWRHRIMTRGRTTFARLGEAPVESSISSSYDIQQKVVAFDGEWLTVMVGTSLPCFSGPYFFKIGLNGEPANPRNQLPCSKFSLQFPRDRVSVGDSWIVNNDPSEFVPAEVSTAYTLKEVVYRNGRPAMHICSVLTARNPKSPGIEVVGSGSGDVYFDLTEGAIISNHSTSVLKFIYSEGPKAGTTVTYEVEVLVEDLQEK